MAIEPNPEVWVAVGTTIGGIIGGAWKVLNDHRKKTVQLEDKVTYERGIQINRLEMALTDLTPRVGRLEIKSDELIVAINHEDARHAVLVSRMESIEKLMQKVLNFFERQAADKLKAQELAGGTATRLKKSGGEDK